MSDRSSPPLPSPGPTDRRRSSFSQGFADFFGRSPPSQNQSTQGTTAYPGPITSAAAQAQRRRLSLTTIGLSGSPSQTSPFNSTRSRGESISSANSASVDESPFEEDGPPSSSLPTTPFARRLSFGARALQDMRTSNGNGHANEGFNFADNLRSRAERASISSASHPTQIPQAHQRAKSVAVVERPIREMPKQSKRPDAFQERILKGDFYMD